MTPGQEALHEAARLETARIYSRTITDTPRRQPAAATVAAAPFPARPIDSYYGPAAAEDLAELIDDTPARSDRPGDRRRIQQAVARGLDNTQISVLLNLPVARVDRERTAMDKASA